METTSDIEYTPLDWANRETRFLRFVETKTRSGDINLQLINCPLSKAPPFWALSYCWGSSTDLAPVSIDGKQVLVRKNLADALVHSDLEPGDHIWADAICINQNDVSERNYQLGFIGQIYTKASQTLVWLGLPTRYTDLASAYSRACEDSVFQIDNDWSVSGGRQKANRRTTSSLDEDYEFQPGTFERIFPNRTYIFQDAMKKMDHVDKAHRGLQDLLGRSYWERVWIIQEIAKSRRIAVKCGNYFFDLELLFLASTFLAEVTFRTRCLLEAIRRFRVQQHQVFANWTRITLLQALVYTRYSLSTDPRDKVFALLGLTKDGSDLVPNPSYADTETEVFRNLTASILNTRHTNNAMLIARHGSQHQRNAAPWMIHPQALEELPPWLIDTSISENAVDEWSFDADRSTLHVWAAKLADTGIISGIPTRPPPSMTPGPSPALTPGASQDDQHQPQIQPENKHLAYLSSLLRRFYRDPSTRPNLEGDVGLTDAFARMIRDADKGFSAYSAQYDLDRARSVLKDIGAITLDHMSISKWAFDHNSMRQTQAMNSKKVSFAHPHNMVRNDSQNASIKIPTAAFQTIQAMLDDLLYTGGFRLKLAVTNKSEPVIIHAKARHNYDIWLVDQCSLPLVLEWQQRSGQYVVSGEACFGRHRDGTWWSARRTLQELNMKGKIGCGLIVQLDPDSRWQLTPR